MAELLQGKVAVVTGAGHPRGIGCAITAAFLSAGAVVVSADLQTDGGPEELVACDVTSLDDVQALVEHVIEQHGRLDVVVNNAGVGVGSGDFLALTDADWELSLAVNLRGVVHLCQTAIPQMRKQGSGAIINVASLAGLGAMESIPACYTASKFAVIGLTRQLAQQFAADGIRCNALCPGSVVTQMHEHALGLLAEQHGISLEEAEALENASIPLGRSAEPEEIGKAAVFLASDLSSYVTGVALPVAGGMAPGL